MYDNYHTNIQNSRNIDQKFYSMIFLFDGYYNFRCYAK